MVYKFVDDVAIADVAFEASGKNLEAMLESAGLALTNTMVKDLKQISNMEQIKLDIKAEDAEKLLHNFLQELIYYKDVKLLLFSKFKMRITSLAQGYRLQAICKGEKIDMKKHELLVDVKAVSWHMFKVEQTKDDWKAFVILDV